MRDLKMKTAILSNTDLSANTVFSFYLLFVNYISIFFNERIYFHLVLILFNYNELMLLHKVKNVAIKIAVMTSQCISLASELK